MNTLTQQKLNEIWNAWLDMHDIGHDPRDWSEYQNVDRTSYYATKFEKMLFEYGMLIINTRAGNKPFRYIRTDNEQDLTVFLLKEPWKDNTYVKG